MLRNSSLLNRRWVRIAPHIVDALLLFSGIVMVVGFHLYPTSQPWLAVKLVALVAYIILGSIALKRGRTRAIRTAALLSSLAVFSYILAVALTHEPVPFV